MIFEGLERKKRNLDQSDDVSESTQNPPPSFRSPQGELEGCIEGRDYSY